MSDENWIFSGKYKMSHIFHIYKFEILYVLDRLGASYQSYADNTQVYFTFEGVTEGEIKLGVTFIKSDQWIRSI